ncbi:MAG: GvpL/GvpF family gas vesicle protein [Acidobacteriia bacterium]|nr:GvpL/GvpF family gas vesicle protein [Terriglobia bacterium]
MSYLVYCVFDEPRWPAASQTPPGVGGQRVSIIEGNRMNAAFSFLDHSSAAPGIPDILAYQQVVEFFHHAQTVIPMRYGCILNETREIVALMAAREEEFRGLLNELDGLVEMGIRVLTDRPHDAPVPPPAAGAGAAYLMARKGAYAMAEQISCSREKLGEQLSKYLDGTFVRSHADSAQDAGPLASFYFLVHRQSVECFSRRSQLAGELLQARLLLTGPWPPYNFCQPQRMRTHGAR